MMGTRSAEGTDYVGAAKGIGPLLDCVVAEVDGELLRLLERVAGRLDLQRLPFVDVGLFLVLGMKGKDKACQRQQCDWK